MEGYQVVRMEDVVSEIDVVITTTGNKGIVTRDHMAQMKNNCIVGNIGHFDNEIDLKGLYSDKTVTRVNIKPQVSFSLFLLSLPSFYSPFCFSILSFDSPFAFSYFVLCFEASPPPPFIFWVFVLVGGKHFISRWIASCSPMAMASFCWPKVAC